MLALSVFPKDKTTRCAQCEHCTINLTISIWRSNRPSYAVADSKIMEMGLHIIDVTFVFQNQARGKSVIHCRFQTQKPTLTKIQTFSNFHSRKNTRKLSTNLPPYAFIVYYKHLFVV